MKEKFKATLRGLYENTELFTVILVVLVALTSFLLGRLSVAEQSHFESSATAIEENRITKGVAESDSVVASKKGTKYHLPWCAGALQMKDENKIVFETREAAEAAGYSPAGNCKGL